MKQRRKARFLAVGIAVATGLGLVTAYALGGSGRRLASVVSPARTYRIDWVTPDRLDRWLHGDMSTASRIALHNNVTGSLVGVSEVVDMDAGGDGQPVWLMKDMGMVSVGPGAQFLHVPPLAPDGHPLPIDKEFSGTTHAEDRSEPKQR